jgi:hypothetical protein
MAFSREQVFEQLIARGATRAIVEFSGGNDEGGPDRVRLLGAQGELPELTICASFKDPTPEETADEALTEGLSQPIYDQYGTFAGDFEVTGELIWDLDNRTVEMVKDEREHWEHTEEYL